MANGPPKTAIDVITTRDASASVFAGNVYVALPEGRVTTPDAPGSMSIDLNILEGTERQIGEPTDKWLSKGQSSVLAGVEKAAGQAADEYSEYDYLCLKNGTLCSSISQVTDIKT